MTKSIVYQGNIITFPTWLGEKIYMQEFKQSSGLPENLKQRWQDAVDAMLGNIKTDKSIFLMVDEGIVKVDNLHRRGGIHVDGYWHPNLGNHGGHGGPYHLPKRGSHGGHRFVGHSSEILCLASNVLASRAFSGEYEGEPKSGGDCSHIDVRNMDIIPIEPNRVYYGDTGALLHESIPVTSDCKRTVIRLNVQV